MSEIATNNRSLYISAANLVSNIIGQKPHNPNIVWNIQLLKESTKVEDATVVQIAVHEIKDLYWEGDVTEEMRSHSEFMNDTMLKGLDKANNHVVARANIAGEFPVIQFYLEQDEDNPAIYRIAKSQMKELNLGNLNCLTHSYSLAGSTYPEFSRQNNEEFFRERFHDIIEAALREAWNPNDFKGLSISASGETKMPEQLRKELEDTYKFVSSAYTLLDNAASECRSLQSIVPAKATAENLDSVSLDTLDQKVQNMADLCTQTAELARSLVDAILRASTPALRTALGQAFVGAPNYVATELNTLSGRMSSYKEEVQARGLNKGDQSEGYEVHIAILRKCESTIIQEICPTLLSIRKGIKTVIDAD